MTATQEFRPLRLMKVVITSATEKEIIQLKGKIVDFSANFGALSIHFHTSGVGLLAASFSITRLIYEEKPDLIIQLGIAGCFDSKMELGKVVIVKEDGLGDQGVEENGRFIDLFDDKQLIRNGKPINLKKMPNPFLNDLNFSFLDEVTACTVNEVTTHPLRIQQLIENNHFILETMEGASLHYCCLQLGIPFVQIRAISNYIGERDKTKWKFSEAFNNLAIEGYNFMERLNALQ